MNVRIMYFCMYLFFISISLTSCQSEDMYVKNKGNGVKSGLQVKTLKGIEAKKAENLLKSVLGKSGGLYPGVNTLMREGEESIDYNNILLVLDTLGIRNYTYKILNHPDDNYKTFHNLVLTEKDGTLELAVMKYEMTDLFAQDYNAFLKTFNEFEGKIAAIGLDPALDPCVEIIRDYPSAAGSNGGGSEVPPVDEPDDPGDPYTGGTESECISISLSFECSCGRSYATFEDYTNSMCGDGSFPGYSLTIVVRAQYLAFCRLPGEPCIPVGSIGVIGPEADCNTSKEALMSTFPNLSEDDAEVLANAINTYGADYGLDNKFKLRHFLSQIGHETGGLSSLNRSEDLNYTTSSRLLTVFSKYFSYTDQTKENPDTYLNNPGKLGNLLYCCRMGNGSIQSEDGYKYRGRGLIQLTGKSNYQSFQNFYNDKYEENIDIINNPDIVTDNSDVAIISAMWYFKNKVINKTLLSSGFDEPVREITKKVNGGLNGLSDRIELHNTCVLNIDCITN